MCRMHEDLQRVGNTLIDLGLHLVRDVAEHASDAQSSNFVDFICGGRREKKARATQTRDDAKCDDVRMVL